MYLGDLKPNTYEESLWSLHEKDYFISTAPKRSFVKYILSFLKFIKKILTPCKIHLMCEYNVQHEIRWKCCPVGKSQRYLFCVSAVLILYQQQKT